ncbi:hypothetical protein F5H01DRAFT_346936 [Linnemannia elongata]|nr:hypothetical protein F5H01DRAFT_346936 [Linnemannia elongata]
MTMNMSDTYGSPSDFEPYSHFAYQASSQLDFTFYSPPHDGSSRDTPMPAAVFNAALPEDMPSLDLTGTEESKLEELLNMDDPAAPRKRDRGERIVWTPEEDQQLRAAVQIYGDKTEKWSKIAACVPGRTNKNCRKRWFHSLDPKLKKGPWTEEEDHLLKTGVEMFKGQWSKIAERIPGRTDDQCAKRWREGLDPLIDRAAWAPEDDILLLQRFEEFGSQWQKIALAFPGRPGLHCRNRWRKIQRSLNHMKRATKRRSQLTASDQAAFIAETRRLEALLDSHKGDLDPELAQFNADDLLLQESYLEDDYNMDGYLDEELTGRPGKGDRGDRGDLVDYFAEDEKPYGCAIPDCLFESSSPSLLYYHFKATHSGTTVEKPFRCAMPGCETRKRYKNVNGLQYHVTHAKNSAAHSGMSGFTTQLSVFDDGPETSSKSGRSVQPSLSPGSTGALNTPPPPVSTPLASSPGLRISMPAATFDPAINMAISNPPTPAEIQLQLHQSKEDLVQQQQQQQTQQQHLQQHQLQQQQAFQTHQQKRQQQQQGLSHLSHSSLNIPHGSPSLDSSATSSQTSSGASSPHFHRNTYHCPELGCDHTFHHLTGLNNHMAQSHGHRAMTMRSHDTLCGSDAMVIPQDNQSDFDIDMTDLSSGTQSPIDTNALLMDDHLLHNHLSSLGYDSDPLGLDSAFGLDLQQEGSSGHSSGFRLFTSKDLIMANQLVNKLHNRMHFGTHINIGVHAHEPSSISQLPPSSPAEVSSTMNPANLNTTPGVTLVPTTVSLTPGPTPTPTTPTKPTKAQGSRPANKKFACTSDSCQKAYASVVTLNNHLRNDHPELSGARTSSVSSLSVLRSPAFMEIPHSPILPKEPAPAADVVLEKPYKCLVPGCGKGYTNINGLKNHLLQMHGSTPKTTTAA